MPLSERNLTAQVTIAKVAPIKYTGLNSRIATLEFNIPQILQPQMNELDN